MRARQQNAKASFWGSLFWWGCAVVLFLLTLALSVQPNLVTGYGFFSYTHLIFLFVVLLLSSGTMPLWLLLVLGGMIDSVQGQLIGSSSAILMLVSPLFRSFHYSTIHRPMILHWCVFALFLLAYLVIQSAIQLFWRGLVLDRFLMFTEYLAAVAIFPVMLFSGRWLKQHLAHWTYK